MTELPASKVLDLFASPFVEDSLCLGRLGGSKSDPDTIGRYMRLPIPARPAVSFYFDREYYWQRYPDIAAVAFDPLVHFIGWGAAEARSPHPLIDIRQIQRDHPGLLPDPPTAAALHDVLSRDLADPGRLFSRDFYRTQLDDPAPEGGLLRHFLEHGILRGLRPIPSLDPVACYRRARVKTADIRSGLRFHALGGTAAQPEAIDDPPSEGQGKALFRAKAQAALLALARAPLDFTVAAQPDVSVIMVVHDNVALTLHALASLRAAWPGPIELILVDSGSSDETRHIQRYVHGAQVLRFQDNVSFVRGCNAGLAAATADAVLYLNNDVALADGAIAAALRRLRSDEGIGAVGAKVIRAHGLLQEAGGIVWRDGWTIGYQRDQPPQVPEANFVRDVDFCSAVFLLVRAAVLHALEGFDDAFAPAYYEDIDLCLRIRAAGHRIVYDPAVVVHHLEYGTSQGTAHERIHAAHETFVRKHADWLRSGHAADSHTLLFARSASQTRGRVLLIEDQVPLRRLGSGFVRSNDVVRAMARLGYHVTVYPIHPNRYSLAAVYGDFPDTVEVMHDRSLTDLDSFLRDRRGYYTTIWIARTHNLDLVRPMLEAIGMEAMGQPRIVLDTEALGATREAQKRDVLRTAERFDADQSLRDELRNAAFCRHIVSVNRQEAARIRTLGLSDVSVLGHVRRLALTPRNWRGRAGLLFVGALHTMDSPNFDSLCWFVDEVLPRVEQQLGYETRLTIAGFVAPDVNLGRFQDHPRVTLRGEVADMTPLYDAHRVFVAPTRFAAGIPYKLHEAASQGIPIVATELLRQQLGWENWQDMLAVDQTDPGTFADLVVTLYQSETLWNQLRAGAAQRIRTECGQAAFEPVVAAILQ
ncbi:glycosyltransferase [Rhodopila globiformis]|uniref:Glycosyltransferase 2-like domain-containing protein n=1 Tax=Rhodopila globiformis TaxID=1071 RepID=A0A2S6N1T8_RHOGL|nr:glycosyltransferase [Rhodopila globiformis]PPQ28582.1 hypothetical protein CCS01_24075 [Rhodopila globiformis]